MEKTVVTLEDTEQEAARFVRSLAPKEAGATLVTLAGDLGAGKTSYTKAVAKTLGIAENVTSPTFVLEKIYVLPEGNIFKKLVHIDAYRLNEGSELSALGFADLLQDAGNLIMLEWPERVADILPTPAVALTLEIQEDGSRKITYG
jgi:tRNA threonylcarbamoyladenosine biosynthesis protein TsaE